MTRLVTRFLKEMLLTIDLIKDRSIFCQEFECDTRRNGAQESGPHHICHLKIWLNILDKKTNFKRPPH